MLTALAVGSALVSAYGQYKSAKAQAEASREQAQLNFLKAEEILSRNTINNELIQGSALVQVGTQQTQIAGSGATMGYSERRLLRDTMEKAARQIQMNNRAAEWEARMTRLGAESQIKSADQIQTAGTINAIGTAVFGTARAYDNSPGGNTNAKD